MKGKMIFCLAALMILTGGCNPMDPLRMASGTTNQYNVKNLKFKIGSTATIAVGVHDQRSYVTSGESRASFVGLVRGGFGTPFRAYTKSGDSLAIEIAESINTALKADGAKSISVPLSGSLSFSNARKRLLKEKATRFVLMTIKEWRSDTYWSTKLDYDVDLKIFGEDGSIRGGRNMQGTEVGRSDAFTPKERSREMVRVKFKKIVEQLFNDPKTAAAIR